MKNYCLLLFIGIFFFSCSNDDEDSKSKITGSWKWIASSGGIDGRTETPESTGKIIKLEISNNLVKRYVNEILESESNYIIKSENFNGEQRDMIYYDNYAINQIIRLNEPYLILFDTCADCFQNEYIRE